MIITPPPCLIHRSLRVFAESPESLASHLADYVTSEYTHFLSQNRFSDLLGGKQKRFSEFLGGKRKRFSEFLGGKRKRFSEFLGGKKRFSEFLGGKRSSPSLQVIPDSYTALQPQKRDLDFLGGRWREHTRLSARDSPILIASTLLLLPPTNLIKWSHVRMWRIWDRLEVCVLPCKTLYSS